MATLAAIIHKMKTGEGQHVQGALLASAITIANGTLIEQQQLNNNRTATGNRGQTSAPVDAFQTKDGWILVQVVGDPLYARWAALMGEDQWITDPKYANDEVRGNNSADISQRMQEWTSQRSTTEAIESLEAARIPCGEVLSPQAALDNEQVAAMKFLTLTDYPGLAKPAAVARMPIDFSAINTAIRHRAPVLGEHTNEILDSLGFTSQDIESFRKEGAI